MSGASWDLQALIYARLVNDVGVASLIADRVYDRPSEDAVYPYVTFGPSDWNEDDAEGIVAREETQQLDIWSIAKDGKRECKAIADAVKASLHEYAGTMAQNALVEMRVIHGQIMDDPDGETTHGILTVTAMIEEH